MTNSADLDQLKKPTDLDLHCLLRQGMWCSAREGLMSTHNIRFCEEIKIKSILSIKASYLGLRQF